MRVKSDLSMVPVSVKVVWRSVSVMNGALCVTRCGMLLMLLWSAGSCTMHPLVQSKVKYNLYANMMVNACRS